MSPPRATVSRLRCTINRLSAASNTDWTVEPEARPGSAPGNTYELQLCLFSVICTIPVPIATFTLHPSSFRLALRHRLDGSHVEMELPGPAVAEIVLQRA